MGKVTQKQLKEHFLSLKDALYVWGANCKVITKEYMDKLFRDCGTDKYDREYYNKALEEGEGKIGSDCSGALNPVSGYDTTAQGYYGRCTGKGKIDTIPKDKVLLVFKRNSKKKITHVGCYTGDGYVSEMASTKKDYQRKPLDGNGWDDWGLPDFVDYDAAELIDVDGSFGTDTVTKSQYVFGTKQDGIVSNQPNTCKQYLPKVSEEAWRFDERESCEKGSSLIKAIQEFLKGLGYYKKKIDGWCGKGTVKAIQMFLRDLGFYTGKISGIMNKATVKGWQKYINSRL